MQWRLGKCSGKRRQRSGAALIELAICLPLLLLLTLATIEACTILHMRQGLKIAAYEGCRVGLVPHAQTSNVETQVANVLAARQIVGSVVTLTPSDPSGVAPGEFFKVTVSAPCEGNLVLRGWFAEGKTYSESVEMLMDH